MKTLRIAILRAALPPIIGFSIFLAIVYFYPNLSEGLYLVLVVVELSIPQLFLLKD